MFGVVQVIPWNWSSVCSDVSVVLRESPVVSVFNNYNNSYLAFTYVKTSLKIHSEQNSITFCNLSCYISYLQINL